MKFSVLLVFLFFFAVALSGVLLFPRPMDQVFLYIQSGETPKAVDLMKDIESRSSGNAGLLFTLSKVYMEIDRPQDARRVLLRAAELRPGDARITQHLLQAAWDDTDAHVWKGDYRGAARIIRQDIRPQEGKDEDIWRKLADLYAAEMMLDEQAEAFHNLLEAEPEDLPALEFLADYHNQSQEPQRAIPMLEAIARIHPEDHARRQLLARLYMASGRLEAACRAWRELLVDFPEDAQAAVLLGLLNESMGQRQAYVEFARAHFNRHLSNHVEVKTLLSRFEQGQPEAFQASNSIPSFTSDTTIAAVPPLVPQLGSPASDLYAAPPRGVVSASRGAAQQIAFPTAAFHAAREKAVSSSVPQNASGSAGSPKGGKTKPAPQPKLAPPAGSKGKQAAISPAPEHSASTARRKILREEKRAETRIASAKPSRPETGARLAGKSKSSHQTIQRIHIDLEAEHREQAPRYRVDLEQGIVLRVPQIYDPDTAAPGRTPANTHDPKRDSTQ